MFEELWKKTTKEKKLPKAGEVWSFIGDGKNPFTNHFLVKVMDVKNGYVLYNFDEDGKGWLNSSSKIGIFLGLYEFKG